MQNELAERLLTDLLTARKGRLDTYAMRVRERLIRSLRVYLSFDTRSAEYQRRMQREAKVLRDQIAFARMRKVYEARGFSNAAEHKLVDSLLKRYPSLRDFRSYKFRKKIAVDFSVLR